MHTSTLSYGRVTARVVSSATNAIIAGLLFAGAITMRERMAWRWDHSHNDRLTIEQIIETDDQNEEPEVETPDLATLSFVDRVDETDATPTSAIPADEEWLAKAIYYEARSEPVAGQVEIAKVILNRRDDPRWPKTVKAVVAEGEKKRNNCQFSFMCDGKPEHPKDERSWQRALAVAKKVYTAWQQGDDFGCVHSYRADYTTSQKALKWFATLQPSKKIGRHIFYCDKRS